MMKNHLTLRMVSLLFAAGILLQSAGTATPDGAAEKAANLRLGMAKVDVIQVLGTPDWVVLETDGGRWAGLDRGMYELRWKNGELTPIIVQFSAENKVTGWVKGRPCAEGDGGARSFYPPDDFSCRRPERKHFCACP
jgi:hypothetical protein